MQVGVIGLGRTSMVRRLMCGGQALVVYRARGGLIDW